MIYFQYYHLSFKPFIMQRTERIEMVLLRKSNELKKKKRYKLLKRLRLCLNILIKNEKKKSVIWMFLKSQPFDNISS